MRENRSSRTLRDKADGHCANEGREERLELANAEVVQQEEGKRVAGGDENAFNPRQTEKRSLNGLGDDGSERVVTIPAQSGSPNRICMAIADPTTSWISALWR